MKKKDNIKAFIDEIYSKPPRGRYPTNKITYNYIDEIWSTISLIWLTIKISNNKGFGYMFIMIDNFSKTLWAIPL